MNLSWAENLRLTHRITGQEQFLFETPPYVRNFCIGIQGTYFLMWHPDKSQTVLVLDDQGLQNAIVGKAELIRTE